MCWADWQKFQAPHLPYFLLPRQRGETTVHTGQAWVATTQEHTASSFSEAPELCSCLQVCGWIREPPGDHSSGPFSDLWLLPGVFPLVFTDSMIPLCPVAPSKLCVLLSCPDFAICAQVIKNYVTRTERSSGQLGWEMSSLSKGNIFGRRKNNKLSHDN